MNILNFDQTFEGLLTLVYESYRLHLFPDVIMGRGENQYFLFSDPLFIPTEEKKADRVWKKIIEKTSQTNANRIFISFHSELPGTPKLIYDYIRLMTDSKKSIETDFTLSPVLEITRLFNSVARETARIRMFTRFQQTAENSYYASVMPEYDVLPLCIHHFTDRFADQEWIIYDLKRNYGFCYNLKETERISFEILPVSKVSGQLYESYHYPDEKQFQKHWKEYFDTICIEERKNYKLHRQMLPKRFWKFLPEKTG
jgi:probable DNA metabolism protein